MSETGNTKGTTSAHMVGSQVKVQGLPVRGIIKGVDAEGRYIVACSLAGVVQRILIQPSRAIEVLPPVQLPVIPGSCNQCGRCCMVGGACDIKAWMDKAANPLGPADPGFVGRCPYLQGLEGGVMRCAGMLSAMDPSTDWHEPTRKWLLGKYMGSGCRFPELRSEVEIQPTTPGPA